MSQLPLFDALPSVAPSVTDPELPPASHGTPGPKRSHHARQYKLATCETDECDGSFMRVGTRRRFCDGCQRAKRRAVFHGLAEKARDAARSRLLDVLCARIKQLEEQGRSDAGSSD